MKKITRFHAIKILDWCKQKYGRGSKPYPYLEYRKADYMNSEYTDGEYDYEDGFMYINSSAHKTLEHLANTIIHEYTHYRYHTKAKYSKLDSQFNYLDHPMEKQADKIARRDQKKCVVELKKYYVQFNY